MNPRKHTFLHWAFRQLLRLYPRSFYEEFASEMQADMADALADAESRGRRAMLTFLVRELVAVVSSAITERWREKLNGVYSGKPMGWADIAVALIPFTMLLLISVSNAARFSLPDWVGTGILGFVGFMIFIGLIRGLPEWSLPCIGLGFGIIGLFSVGYAYRVLSSLYQLSSDPTWRTILNGGVMWWGIVVLVPILIILTAVVKPWRPFYERVRADWTVLSFALYGNVPVAPLGNPRYHYYARIRTPCAHANTICCPDSSLKRRGRDARRGITPRLTSHSLSAHNRMHSSA